MITLNRSACQYARRFYSKPESLLIIPLVLSAFTHLWNPIGFPYVHGDEGHYMRRAMNILEGFGPQEQRNITWTSEQLYDHPYFGQLFLATVLGIIGYPHILDLKPGDVVSIEMLHIVPRLLMGILAVVDTFLLYYHHHQYHQYQQQQDHHPHPSLHHPPHQQQLMTRIIRITIKRRTIII